MQGQYQQTKSPQLNSMLETKAFLEKNDKEVVTLSFAY